MISALREIALALRRLVGIGRPPIWSNETAKCRDRLAPFCSGYGIDVGCGGDSIVEHAIRVDLCQPYTRVGNSSIQLGGDAEALFWFRDGVLDFVYSSHLLEDFPNTETVLREWLRVLKPSGRLVLYCPDERVYRLHCAATGQPYNTNHKHAEFSLESVKSILRKISGVEFIHEEPLVDCIRGNWSV